MTKFPTANSAREIAHGAVALPAGPLPRSEAERALRYVLVSSSRERDDAYRTVVVVLNARWRVIDSSTSREAISRSRTARE